MSITELKAQAAQLSPAEKAELAEYLRQLADPKVAARQLRVANMMAEMDAGRKFTRRDFEQMDGKLSAEGL
ncbi:MAG TPA: hypothetical protein VMM36_01040 [Opitutaceae bacterium]|nr:hypothetical protein [Opitutaceae bacterium]